jgi:phosphoglycerate dehydrogenase-like enzyme
MNVIAIRRHASPPRPSFRPSGIEFLDERSPGVTVVDPGALDEVVGAADHLVIAVPRTPATTDLIGAHQLARMKPTSHLVNVARGGIVNEPALAEALRAGRPGFATLDVTAIEPPAATSPFYNLPNARMTPHIAGYFAGYEDAAAMLFAANLRRYVAAESLLNRVDRAEGY